MRFLAPLLVLSILCAPWLAPHDPQRTLTMAWLPPSGQLWLGSDGLGRDLLSRLLSGGREILLLPLICAMGSSLTGLLLAMIMVALPGRGRRLVALLDPLLMMPPLLIMIGAIYVFGSGIMALIAAVTLLNAPFTTRYLRAMADPLLDTGYVEAARAAGDSSARLICHELLPVLIPAILTDAVTRLIAAIYLLASASFLGFASAGNNWAAMVRDGLPGLWLNPWAALLPALCIAVVVLSLNALSERWSVK